MASAPEPVAVLRCSSRSQENHEAGFPVASMPWSAGHAHTVLGTGSKRYAVPGPVERLVRIFNQECHHEVGNPGSCRNPFWLRNHDVRGQSVNSPFLDRGRRKSINPPNDAAPAGFRHRAPRRIVPPRRPVLSVGSVSGRFAASGGRRRPAWRKPREPFRVWLP